MSQASVPQSLLDQVTGVYNAKLTAEASAAVMATDGQTVITAQAALSASTAQAQADSDALTSARKSLEALEDVFFTVGGTIPPPATSQPSPPSSPPAPSTPPTQGN